MFANDFRQCEKSGALQLPTFLRRFRRSGTLASTALLFPLSLDLAEAIFQGLPRDTATSLKIITCAREPKGHPVTALYDSYNICGFWYVGRLLHFIFPFLSFLLCWIMDYGGPVARTSSLSCFSLGVPLAPCWFLGFWSSVEVSWLRFCFSSRSISKRDHRGFVHVVVGDSDGTKLMASL